MTERTYPAEGGKTLAELKALLDGSPHLTRREVRALISHIEELQTRLEMNFAYQMIDGKMTKVAVEPGSIPDGIECRDETIRQQGRHIEEQRARIEELERALSPRRRGK